MTDDTYRPISCDFHDLLEASATQRKTSKLEVRDADGGLRELSARITDIETHADGEYVLLDRGEEIRLDRIVSIDGAQAADYPD
ncbi:hypothetical protein [Luteimonas terrae]|nr:hypothetical protein [Luteimonas terrae]